MGTGYEVHRLVVRTEDNLVDILNNITSNTEVILREGTHAAATQILIPSGLTNVTIKGTKASVINITYNGDNPIAIQAAATDITFEGFSVQYNGSASGSTPLFAPIGSGGAAITRLTIRNIHAEFVTGDITFVRWDSEDIDIYGLMVLNNHIYGANPKGLMRFQMASGRTFRQGRILGNVCDRATAGGAQGFAMYGAGGTVEDIEVSDNSFRNLQETPWLDFNSGTCRNFVFTNNVIKYADLGNDSPQIFGDIENANIADNIFDTTGKTACLTIGSGTYMKVADNQFINSPGDGLIIGSGVTDSTIDNNTAENCADNGIEVNGDNNRISNNVCEGNDYGILEGALADGNHYVGNTCRNNTTADKSLSGTGRRQGVNFW